MNRLCRTPPDPIENLADTFALSGFVKEPTSLGTNQEMFDEELRCELSTSDIPTKMAGAAVKDMISLAFGCFAQALYLREERSLNFRSHMSVFLQVARRRFVTNMLVLEVR